MQALGSAELLSAKQWAAMTYGPVRLGDQRRTQRAVMMAERMAADPQASLPAQMGNWANTKAAYRFLESGQIHYEQLMRPHLSQTQALMRAQAGPILLIQDMTEVSLKHHPATSGLGPIGPGNKGGKGYLLQSVLAVQPKERQVLGLAAQEAFLRQRAPKGETSAGRRKRKQKESQVWIRQVEAIGSAPQGQSYVHVGDRGSDIFAFLRACTEQGCGFLVRVQHDRRVDQEVAQAETPIAPGATRHGTQRPAEHAQAPRHLFEEARSWPGRGEQMLVLDGNQKRPQREVHLCISWGTLRLWPPDREPSKDERPMLVSVIRTWEPHPEEGGEALEWLLLCSVAVEQEAEAWERVDWYRMRWIVEDYHQGLKTGCQLEGRQLQTYEGFHRLLGFLAPLAVRLLQIRSAARQAPSQAASEVLPADVLKVVAHLANVAPEQLNVGQCWHRIAQAGGYLGRKGDGEPGWKTLWKGWLYIQTLLEGVHLASQLSLE